MIGPSPVRTQPQDTTKHEEEPTQHNQKTLNHNNTTHKPIAPAMDDASLEKMENLKSLNTMLLKETKDRRQMVEEKAEIKSVKKERDEEVEIFKREMDGLSRVKKERDGLRLKVVEMERRERKVGEEVEKVRLQCRELEEGNCGKEREGRRSSHRNMGRNGKWPKYILDFLEVDNEYGTIQNLKVDSQFGIEGVYVLYWIDTILGVVFRSHPLAHLSVSHQLFDPGV